MEMRISVISQAAMQLFSSRDGCKNWVQAIAMMCHSFSRHTYGANAATRQERREDRAGDIYRGEEWLLSRSLGAYQRFRSGGRGHHKCHGREKQVTLDANQKRAIALKSSIKEHISPKTARRNKYFATI